MEPFHTFLSKSEGITTVKNNLINELYFVSGCRLFANGPHTTVYLPDAKDEILIFAFLMKVLREDIKLAHPGGGFSVLDETMSPERSDNDIAAAELRVYLDWKTSFIGDSGCNVQSPFKNQVLSQVDDRDHEDGRVGSEEESGKKNVNL